MSTESSLQPMNAMSASPGQTTVVMAAGQLPENGQEVERVPPQLSSFAVALQADAQRVSSSSSSSSSATRDEDVVQLTAAQEQVGRRKRRHDDEQDAQLLQVRQRVHCNMSQNAAACSELASEVLQGARNWFWDTVEWAASAVGTPVTTGLVGNAYKSMTALEQLPSGLEAIRVSNESVPSVLKVLLGTKGANVLDKYGEVISCTICIDNRTTASAAAAAIPPSSETRIFIPQASNTSHFVVKERISKSDAVSTLYFFVTNVYYANQTNGYLQRWSLLNKLIPVFNSRHEGGGLYQFFVYIQAKPGTYKIGEIPFEVYVVHNAGLNISRFQTAVHDFIASHHDKPSIHFGGLSGSTQTYNVAVAFRPDLLNDAVFKLEGAVSNSVYYAAKRVCMQLMPNQFDDSDVYDAVSAPKASSSSSSSSSSSCSASCS